MPGSDIGIIELKTNPREQSWHARITGGEAFGELIIIPTDDEVGDRNQLLVQADGVGGPYTVTVEPDLIAGNIDWKGNKRVEDEEGNPLEKPVTDVLSWKGPANRVGPGHRGAQSLTTTIFKGGLIYALAPGPVVAAAIQGPVGGDRFDVVITNTDATSGGPQGTGSATWSVYKKTEGRIPGLGDPGLFDPDTNPNGWKLIEALAGPDDLQGERWNRMRCWYFNRSGTQVSALIPVTDTPAVVLRRNQLPAVGTVPSRYPMKIRLMSIDIDAFAETAVLNDEGREDPFTTSRVFVSATCSAGGGMGSPITASSASSEITIQEGGTRRIGVDYKGDTRVFATMQAVPGAGSQSEFATNTTVGPTTADPIFTTASSAVIEDFGWTLKVGPTEIDLIRRQRETIAALDTEGLAGPGTFTQEIPIDNSDGSGLTPNGTTRILYCDLRNDVLIWATGRTIITSSSAGPVQSQDQPNLGFLSCTMNVVFADASTESTDGLLIEEYVGSNLVRSYNETNVRTSGVGTANHQMLGTVWTSTPEGIIAPDPCCGDFSAFSPVAGVTKEFSFENFTPLDDDFSPQDGLRPTVAAVDTAGNVASSITTHSGIEIFPSPAPGWTPGGVPYLNFISGDDLIDVMNQVEHFDPGPDMELGTEDDILLPPVSQSSGRATLIEVI
jgi:hypothetical protein